MRLDLCRYLILGVSLLLIGCGGGGPEFQGSSTSSAASSVTSNSSSNVNSSSDTSNTNSSTSSTDNTSSSTGNSTSSMLSSASGDNNPPEAVISGSGDWTLALGEALPLSAAESQDPDGNSLTFLWSLASVPSGSALADWSAATVDTTFTADVPGDYFIWLQVNDGEFTANAVASLVVTGNSTETLLPVANAGANNSTRVGVAVTLDGSGADPAGNPVTCSWSVSSVPDGSAGGVLTNENNCAPSFTPDVAGQFILALTVSNGSAVSAPDTVTLTATEAPVLGNLCPEHAFFCDSFEDFELGEITAEGRYTPRDKQGKVNEDWYLSYPRFKEDWRKVVIGEDAHQGAKAVQFTSIVSEDPIDFWKNYLVYDFGDNNTIGEYYGRVFIKIKQYAIQSHPSEHWYMLASIGLEPTPAWTEGDHVRIIDFYGLTDPMPNPFNVDGREVDSDVTEWSFGSRLINQSLFTLHQWACIEWHYDSVTGKVVLWRDGEKMVEGTSPEEGIYDLHPAQAVALGFGKPHTGPYTQGFDIWYDDFAVSTTARIGCGGDEQVTLNPIEAITSGPTLETSELTGVTNGRGPLAESPVWDATHNRLIFSSMSADAVKAWDSQTKSLVTLKGPNSPSYHQTNGVALDAAGNRVELQELLQRVVRYNTAGKEEILVTQYSSENLNSPNDLVIHSNGTIYFTDPRYGTSGSDRIAPMHDRREYGVYRLGSDGSLEQIYLFTNQLPNGIALSADESRLYVANNSASTILTFDLNEQGEVISAGQVLVSGLPAAPDGFCVDEAENLYIPAGNWGDINVIAIADASGTILGQIEMPDEAGNVTNCAFGGPDMQTLFVTTSNSLWSLQTQLRGVKSLAARARDYLQTNCAGCHSPTGQQAALGMDLRANLNLVDMGICKVSPVIAERGASRLTPGDAGESAIYNRIALGEMPFGATHADVEGADLIRRWINAMPATSCDLP